MKGSGKYGEIGRHVLEETKATCIAVIVFEGNKGDGFEVQMRPPFELKAHRTMLAIVLRDMASKLEADA